MQAAELKSNILSKKSFLCIGLDTDKDKIPDPVRAEENPMFAFNKAIVDATHQYCVAYKINTAFYEALGAEGWQALENTAAYIKEQHPEIFLIADAKRGDIGNTGRMYARAFFSALPFDAVTLSPYMGKDSIEPFLEFNGKWVILLGLTSNQGAFDFQYFHSAEENLNLFEKVLLLASQWGSVNNTMFVCGGTRPEELSRIRRIVPDHFLLVPGIGKQGGSIEEIAAQGMNDHVGLLVNASRSIIFADPSAQFATSAARNAREMQEIMHTHLQSKNLL